MLKRQIYLTFTDEDRKRLGYENGSLQDIVDFIMSPDFDIDNMDDKDKSYLICNLEKSLDLPMGTLANYKVQEYLGNVYVNQF